MNNPEPAIGSRPLRIELADSAIPVIFEDYVERKMMWNDTVLAVTDGDGLTHFFPLANIRRWVAE
jgi:hypothetical protein